jgi:hypothetical protein
MPLARPAAAESPDIPSQLPAPAYVAPQDGALVVYSLSGLAGAHGALSLDYAGEATLLSFTLPQDWRPIADGRLEIGYSLSETSPGHATLHVELNGYAVAEATLDEMPGRRDVLLPAIALQPGTNALLLRVTSPSWHAETGAPHRVDLTPASALVLTLRAVNDMAGILPPTHLDPLTGGAPLTFVLPPVPTSDELDALSAAVLAVVRAKGGDPAADAVGDTGSRWRVVSADRFGGADVMGPVVLIGAAGRHVLLDAMAPHEAPTSGWVMMARPDWAEGYAVLAIGGEDGRAVRRAARALLDPATRLQVRGAYAVPTGEWPALPAGATVPSGGTAHLEAMWPLLARASWLDDLAILLPAHHSFDELGDAVALVRLLASTETPIVSAPRWVPVDGVGREIRSASLIVLGETARQPVLAQALGRRLPVRLMNGINGLPAHVNGGDVGAIQIIPSPWADGRVVLAISGNAAGGYRAALDALLEESTRARLVGDAIIVVREAGHGSLALYSRNAVDSPAPSALSTALGRGSAATLSPALVVLLVGGAMALLAGLSAVGAGMQSRTTRHDAARRPRMRPSGGRIG